MYNFNGVENLGLHHWIQKNLIINIRESSRIEGLNTFFDFIADRLLVQGISIL